LIDTNDDMNQKLPKMSTLANITSPAFIGRVGLGSKKIVHRLVFVRHGESAANQKNTYVQKKFLDSPLSSLGHSQANDVAEYLTKIGFVPDKIVVSRLSRAVDTAKPFIDINTIPVVYSENIVEYNGDNDEVIDDNIGSWLYKKESRSEFIVRVSEYLEETLHSSSFETKKQTLFFTHSHVISAILTNSIFGIKNNVNVFFHIANCSITCIDVDEDGSYHVQAVNYTKHLDEPTGQHSPFV